MNELISLCKRRGFIFPSSEIYGGINGFWDYGPLGVELKRALKDYWWDYMVKSRDNVVGLDASLISHPQTWVASGHVANFNDPMVDCRKCKKRFRADQLDESGCPSGGAHDLTEARSFNLMFQTYVGAVQDEGSIAYLRPETCQPIFTNFKQVLIVSRQKVPFGIAQIGKAFRNEINPRNFIFRSREFEQMEMEFFIRPGEDLKWHEYWVEERFRWYQTLGVRPDKLRKRPHAPDELAHYAKAAVDIEYQFPFGWQELEGIACRGDFDLKQHIEHSGKDLSYFDEETKERFTPCVIEPSAGVDRTLLTLLADAFEVESLTDDKGAVDERVVLRLHPKIAPVQVAVFPLVKKLDEPCREIERKLRKHFRTNYDLSGAIGRRYRRQDEIGTPFALTFDFDSLEDKKVTVRDRDSMTQERVPVDELVAHLEGKMEGWTRPPVKGRELKD